MKTDFWSRNGGAVDGGEVEVDSEGGDMNGANAANRKDRQYEFRESFYIIRFGRNLQLFTLIIPPTAPFNRNQIDIIENIWIPPPVIYIMNADKKKNQNQYTIFVVFM